MYRSVVAIGLAAAICGSAACGQPARPHTNSDYQNAYAKAYEEAFRAAFRSKSVEQCVASAPKAAAGGYDITPTCTCVADELLGTKTVEELTNVSPDALQPLVAQCLTTNPPVLSARR